MSIEKKPDWLRKCVILFLLIQPLVDMDYLFYDVLDAFGLPRFSTILRFVILPILIILVFLKHDQKKKTTILATVGYGLVLLLYFFLHCRQAQALFSRLDFTDNFRFSMFQELTYVLTLVIPYFVVYMVYQIDLTQKEIKKIVLFEATLIAVTIVLGDLFVFAKSTYYGDTVGNFFSWFTGIYEWYHPRTLASKFFFNEGNTIGILLFMLLPLVYYFFYTAETKNEARYLGALIFVQSLSMQMLATRVATYGAMLIPVLFLCLIVFDAWVRKEKPSFGFVGVVGVVAVMFVLAELLVQRTKNQSVLDILTIVGWVLSACCFLCLLYVLYGKQEKQVQKSHVLLAIAFFALFFASILDFTPAIQNQKVDAKNDVALLHNGMADLGREELKNAEDLIPGTPEYINFYVYMFETYGINARYIQSVPSMYYTEYYSYQHDPKFWTDVCFMDVYDRVSGRQIETIFFNYKYKNLTPTEKILGMGYSSFMNGSIVLEQDFKQQIYTLGYAGFAICIMPWLLLCAYGMYAFVRYRKSLWNLFNYCMVMSLASSLGSGWLSGHVLDQFVTNTFMALVAAYLLREVSRAKKVSQ